MCLDYNECMAKVILGLFLHVIVTSASVVVHITAYVSWE